MKKKKTCCNCGKLLVKDEVALSRKLLDSEEEAYCVPCMAENFGCAEDDLRIKIQEFKEQGCTLFL